MAAPSRRRTPEIPGELRDVVGCEWPFALPASHLAVSWMRPGKGFVMAEISDTWRDSVVDDDGGPSFEEDRQRTVEDAIQFLALVGELSARLVSPRADQIDDAIQDAQRVVISAFGLERSAIFQSSGRDDDFVLTHGYSRPGLPTAGDGGSAAGQFPWSLNRIRSGEIACFSSIDDIPDAAERESARDSGTSSRAAFPISVDGGVAGVMVFSGNPDAGPWLPEVLGRLKVIAQVFGSALARKRADAALQASERRFRTLADCAPVMMWVSGPDKRSTWVNRRWLEFVGHTMEHEMGDGWVANVHPDDLGAAMHTYTTRFDERQPFRMEYRLRRHDGEWRWVLATGAPHFEADDVFAGYIGSAVDVTEQKSAAQELERLRDQLQAENVYLRREVKEQLSSGIVVGQTGAIRRVLEQIEQVAATDATVLLLGETGTGKELFAAQIPEWSARHGRAMVRVNCAAIPATLIESELFGREKGAFTGALARQVGRFELAHHSTIFLDEIGDLPTDVQVKLLRVLEERTIERLGSPRPIAVDTRIIAATHRNLEQRVAEGTFREDLYYRLNVFPIHVPPLRERVEDIPLLVWRFIEEFSKAFAKRIDSIDRDTLSGLQPYTWPGTILDLPNVVERAMIVSTSRRLTIAAPRSSAAAGRRSAKLADIEKEHIRGVLESTRWRIRGTGGASDRLGLKPTTLETRMAKLGLTRPGHAHSAQHRLP